ERGPLAFMRAISLAALSLSALLALAAPGATAQEAKSNSQAQAQTQPANLPPRVIEARRFLSDRGWTPACGLTPKRSGMRSTFGQMNTVGIEAETAATATWQPLGPTAVQTPGFGLVTGRVTALALDPSDATGNRLYLGTTGGGVWVSQNVATSKSASVVFTPMTDTLATLGGAVDASISIGASTVQPGGTRVI